MSFHPDRCERELHRFVQTAVCQCGKQGSGPYRAEGREGLVNVYDAFGYFLGCMGEETWNRLVSESKHIDGVRTREEAF